MRSLALPLSLIAFALGGVALAQPSLVVDPWGRGPNDSWFAASTDARPVATPATATRDPWASPNARSAPEATPATKVASPPTVARSTAAFEPLPDELVIDPWARSDPTRARSTAAANVTDGTAHSPQRVASALWAVPLVDVVDPWKHTASAAGGDSLNLIVDPWAH